MPLILEDGTGLPNSNSYADIAEADAIHARSLYVAEWNDATSPTKETALMMATRLIDDDMIFNGYQGSTAQALKWPRIRVRNYNTFSGYVPGRLSAWGWNYYDETSIPARLKEATAVIALDLLRGDRTLENSAKGISSIGVGQGAVTLSFSKSDRPQPISESGLRILSEFGSPRYGGGMVRVIRV